LDAAIGKILHEDQAGAKGYPASFLKLMDLMIILEKIEQKQLSLEDQLPLSAQASHTGGSRVWLANKESPTVDEMLYALMILSANHVAVALAEKVAGSTDALIELLNRRAEELGMNIAVFHPVHGLAPGKGRKPDVTTERDLSILCRELLKPPDTLRYTATRERPFRPKVVGKTLIRRRAPAAGGVKGSIRSGKRLTIWPNCAARSWSSAGINRAGISAIPAACGRCAPTCSCVSR
jgi:D-alanyl-D-alanine carboxypeptidase